VVIAGGSGLIGRALAVSLLRDGVDVDVLTRDPARRSRHVAPGARVLHWDPRDAAGVDELSRTLDGASAVVNLTGVPIGPLPWTAWRRRAIVDSRVGPTQSLVEAIALLSAPARPGVFVCALGIDGYTGLDTDPATEATDTSATTGFLADLERPWASAALGAEALGVRVVLVRTAFVLARENSLLPLLALPVRLGLGGRYGSGRQWFSWIHLDDLVAAYRFAIADAGVSGPVIAASPEPCHQHDLAAALARVLHRPNWLPVPGWLLRLVLREEATLLLGSRRVVPARLLEASFAFAFSELDAALRDVLNPARRDPTSGS
jgi:hypothetical protein